MAPSLSADSPEEAARVRAENDELRAQNLRLRAAVTAARPETPVHPPTPAGGALGAADRLVHLMREGGHLLREREALRAENAALETELQEFIGEDPSAEQPAAAAAGADEGAAGPVGAEEGEEDHALLLDRLVPLLSEGDQLRTEREGLRAERQELLSELGSTEAADVPPCEELSAGDQELEARFLAAVEDASRENANLEAEIKRLRDENARLKCKNAPAVKAEAEAVNADAPVAADKVQRSVKPFVSPIPVSSVKKAPEPDDFDVSFQQREAMAALLRKSQGVTSPTARSAPGGRGPSLNKGKQDLDKGQEDQLKGALHTLFKNFGK